MENFKQITPFSYDIFGIIITIIILFIFITIFYVFNKKNKNDDPIMKLFDMFISMIIFTISLVFIIILCMGYFKEHATYEGKFKVVQSNTNEILSDSLDLHQIKLKDKQGNIQQFNVDDKQKYHKGDIVKVKIKAKKGIKPTLGKYISTNKHQNNYKQLLISINKVK